MKKAKRVCTRVNNLNNANTENKREELCRALLVNQACNLFQRIYMLSVSRRGPRVLLHSFRREVIPVKLANEEILFEYLPVNRIPPLKQNCTAG